MGAWISQRIEWWRNHRLLLYDFAEIWTDDRRDFILIWSREIAVGFFLVFCFTLINAAFQHPVQAYPDGPAQDAVTTYLQHTNEQRFSIIESRVDRHDDKIASIQIDLGMIKAQMDETIWYRRMIIGFLCANIIGIAGLFAKIRMGGNRR